MSLVADVMLRAFRVVAIAATIASLGFAPVEEALHRDQAIRSDSLASTPIDTLPVVPDSPQPDEEPVSDPIDGDLPEPIEVAGWEALPRHGLPELSLPPLAQPTGTLVPPPLAASVPTVVLASSRTLLCTRLCRLTC